MTLEVKTVVLLGGCVWPGKGNDELHGATEMFRILTWVVVTKGINIGEKVS